jgi:adenylate cyclase
VRVTFLPRSHRLGQLARGLLTGVAAALCGLGLVMTPLGTTFEREYGLDWLFSMRGAIKPPPGVVVVAINSTTGRALDLPKLPRDWPRTTHAELVKRLVERHAGVIVFDMDFSRAKSGYEDSVFASAIAEANRIVLFEWLAGRKERIIDATGADGGWTWVEEKQSPTPLLASSAKALGPFPLPKLGKAAFEFWAFKSSAGDAATTAAIALQLSALDIYDQWLAVLKEARAAGLEELPAHSSELREPADIQQLMQRLRRAFQEDPGLWQRVAQILHQKYDPGANSRDGRLLEALAALYAGPEYRYLNFYGPPGTIQTLPYQAVLANQGAAGAEGVGDLAGKVVFVGYSDLYDPDQPDRFYTAFTGSDGVDLSGVEIMATAFANLLTQRAVWPSDTIITVLCVLWFGLTVGVVIYLLPAMIAVPSAFAFTAVYVGIVQWQFNDADLWLPLAIPVLGQLPLALLIGLLGQYLLERRKERQFARAISYYLPENIVKDLTEKRLDPSSVNKVVFGTCLATDMSGFTALSESKSPTELAAFMNRYFDSLAQALKRHDVDVTEFHADTIMCAWTASERSPGVSRKAALAAIEVSEAIDRFAHEHGSMRLIARIGLQNGSIYLGHTGGGGRFAYSILGDAANTASRLESLNRYLGTRVLAGASVVRGANGLRVRPLGSFRLLGKADPTSIVEILGKQSGAGAEELDLHARFADALAAFQSEQWSKAAALFEAITERFADDGPSRFYLNRCRRYVADPPIQPEPTVIQMENK